MAGPKLQRDLPAILIGFCTKELFQTHWKHHLDWAPDDVSVSDVGFKQGIKPYLMSWPYWSCFCPGSDGTIRVIIYLLFIVSMSVYRLYSHALVGFSGSTS